MMGRILIAFGAWVMFLAGFGAGTTLALVWVLLEFKKLD